MNLTTHTTNNIATAESISEKNISNKYVNNLTKWQNLPSVLVDKIFNNLDKRNAYKMTIVPQWNHCIMQNESMKSVRFIKLTIEWLKNEKLNLTKSVSSILNLTERINEITVASNQINETKDILKKLHILESVLNRLDLKAISHFIQKKIETPKYMENILVISAFKKTIKSRRYHSIWKDEVALQSIMNELLAAEYVGQAINFAHKLVNERFKDIKNDAILKSLYDFLKKRVLELATNSNKKIISIAISHKVEVNQPNSESQPLQNDLEEEITEKTPPLYERLTIDGLLDIAERKFHNKIKLNRKISYDLYELFKIFLDSDKIISAIYLAEHIARFNTFSSRSIEGTELTSIHMLVDLAYKACMDDAENFEELIDCANYIVNEINSESNNFSSITWKRKKFLPYFKKHNIMNSIQVISKSLEELATTSHKLEMSNDTTTKFLLNYSIPKFLKFINKLAQEITGLATLEVGCMRELGSGLG